MLLNYINKFILFLKMPSPQGHTNYIEAKKKIEHYCAYQERCHLEVIEKLRGMGMYSAECDQLLGHLIQENYLNETRFAQAFARGKFRIKKWGKNRIIRELQQRKISDYNLKKGLAEIDENDYLETIASLADKFWETHNHRTLPLQKKKVVNALYYRGWESELIYTQIRRLENQQTT